MQKKKKKLPQLLEANEALQLRELDSHGCRAGPGQVGEAQRAREKPNHTNTDVALVTFL